jgi:Cu/Ag efflux pump CusA
VLVALSVVGVLGMGGELLPPFNEGTLTVNVLAEPGTSLRESGRLGRRVEELLLEVPEVVSVARRTGRAEMDEHAEGVHSSELEVRLAGHDRPRPGWWAGILRSVPGLRGWGVEEVGRPRALVVADVRDRVTSLPGVRVNVGQPISHRLDHVLSGVRAQGVVKVFGPDLRVLRATAHDIQDRLRPVAGVVDLQVEPQAETSQVRLEVRRENARQYGLAPGDVARLLETAYRGRVVSEILDGDRRFDLVVWYDEATRGDPAAVGATLLDTPSGRKVALEQVARVLDTTGPNMINREGVQRRVAVSFNVHGRDLAAVAADVRRELAAVEEKLRATPGYRVELGGEVEARQEADRRLLLLGTLAVVAVFAVLCQALASWRAALQVLANVPLAAVGSVVALALVNRPDAAALAAAPWWHWPAVWLGATTLSLAHWVGFITLVGIVCRNGILMITHYQHLVRHEGEAFGEAMIVRGTLERLAPVLMTAAVAVIGLVPLALGAGETGKEVLHPLAVVVIGGLVASTLLDQVVTPALFFLFGRHACAGRPGDAAELRQAARLADMLAPPAANGKGEAVGVVAADGAAHPDPVGK